MKSFWDRINFLLRGETLAEFCRSAGLDYQKIKKASQRKALLDTLSLTKIVSHYRVDLNWLVEGNDSPSKLSQIIGKKIKSLRKLQKLDLVGLSKKVSIKPHILEQYEKGVWKFPLNLLEDLAQALAVSPKDFFVKEISLPVQIPELKVVQPASTTHAPKIRDEDYVSIPLTDSSIAAGQPIIQENKIKDYVLLHVRATGKKQNLVASRVDGESMEPMLHSGDIVVVDRDDKRITKNNMFAIFYEDGLTAKFVERQKNLLILRPINPNSEVQIINLEENPDPVVGRIIGAWKEFK